MDATIRPPTAARTGVVPAAGAAPSAEEFLVKCERDFTIVRRLGTDILVAQHADFRRETLERVLHVVKMFFKFDFGYQEQFMFTNRYPGCDAHARQHQRYVHELDKIKRAFDWRADVYDDVRRFYSDLVGNHIAVSDAGLVDYTRRELVS